MTAPNEVAPATKSDIKLLMEELGKIYDATERWKDELTEQTERQRSATVSEVKRHFDFAVEQVRHDLLAANRERIELLHDRSNGHENRITRMTQLTGYIAA